MKISSHFYRSEFACKCGECEFDTVDVHLLRVLEDLRLWFDTPVIVTSGCRCEKHNTSVGGSENSQHLYGRAADIKMSVSPARIYEYLDENWPTSLGLGLYDSWVHVDTRTVGPARWQKVRNNV